MAHGGSRQGAGRKPGAATKLNEEARKQAAEGGLMPLDYMLSILRDESLAPDARMDAAKAAAPYVHAKLSSVDNTGEVVRQFVARIPHKAPTTDQWLQQHTSPVLKN